MLAKWKSMLAGLGLAVALLAPGMAAAQTADPAQPQTQVQRQNEQPLNNAPVWREVRSGNPGFATSTIKSPEATVLVNSSGQSWRQFRNGPVTLYGGILVIVVATAILLFYKAKGPLQLHQPPTGRLIQRFSDWQRLIHWSTAITFVTLAITGLIMFFGKYVLLPILGYTLFSWLAKLSITLHNFLGPLFGVCVVLLFFTFIKKNFWRPYDWGWIKKGGGLATGEHIPSGFFNAGEKLWFWGGLTVLGLVVSASGFVLDFANFNQSRDTMQAANLIHLIGALLFVIGSFGHIYMGTIGMAGAFNAMRTGYVDETWAKEHHEFWYNEVKSGKAQLGSAPGSTARANA
ncbi:MAG: formate dehydrogenase subunit gamma [Burkholderiales bacterium]|nr:formate dehydrogenase subunit gamma [Burkholderiales bacterium]